MKIVSIVGVGALLIAAGFGPVEALADDAPVEFTEAYLNDPANFEQGKEIWFEQCTHCHGFKAYPGKAPKLKPKRYTPAFVYRRVTKGFKKMPAWEEVYEKEELMAVVAYVKHRKFSP
ncbi:MAG: cytochrome c [Rhizobiaceae bacterium]|nr:cytochrome c [Rhizobiaceae bacterium]